MSPLPQGFPNLFAPGVQLHCLPECVSGAIVVLDIEKISIPRGEVYTSGENGSNCKGRIKYKLYLHEAEGCAFTIPGLGPTGPDQSALARVFQSFNPMSQTQPADATVGKHGGVKWVYLNYLHLQ